MTKRYNIALLLKELENMTMTEKLKYTVHFISDEDSAFPKLFIYGSNRSSNLNYLDNPFVYSTSSDSSFCFHCALFFPKKKRKNLNVFSNVGCNSWHINKRKWTHAARNYHNVTAEVQDSLWDTWRNNRLPWPLIDYHGNLFESLSAKTTW